MRLGFIVTFFGSLCRKAHFNEVQLVQSLKPFKTPFQCAQFGIITGHVPKYWDFLSVSIILWVRLTHKAAHMNCLPVSINKMVNNHHKKVNHSWNSYNAWPIPLQMLSEKLVVSNLLLWFIDAFQFLACVQWTFQNDGISLKRQISLFIDE